MDLCSQCGCPSGSTCQSDESCTSTTTTTSGSTCGDKYCHPPLLTWDPVPGAISYHYQFGTDSTFPDPSISEVIFNADVAKSILPDPDI